MTKYFVTYEGGVKANYTVKASSNTVLYFMVSLMNKEFWVEVNFIEYWMYKLFYKPSKED